MLKILQYNINWLYYYLYTRGVYKCAFFIQILDSRIWLCYVVVCQSCRDWL